MTEPPVYYLPACDQCHTPFHDFEPFCDCDDPVETELAVVPKDDYDEVGRQRSAEGDLLITVRREDAYVMALGPLEYAVKEQKGAVPSGGSPRRIRIALAKALGLETDD